MNVRKAARRLVKTVAGKPAEILLSATGQNGRVQVETIPFTTPALEEAARANVAAAAIDAMPRLRNNVRQLLPPVEKREDRTSPTWRHAEYERLSAIPPESWSPAERLWIGGYSVMGDYVSEWMRASSS
jgi:hypothetical protein